MDRLDIDAAIEIERQASYCHHFAAQEITNVIQDFIIDVSGPAIYNKLSSYTATEVNLNRKLNQVQAVSLLCRICLPRDTH